MSDTDSGSEAIPHGVADERDAPADPPPSEPPPVVSPEVERLRVEVRHRDQMLAVAEQRRAGLEREIERLERQLLAAIEAQREDAHERAELRRLLGNAQLQAHSLMQLPAPTADPPPDGQPAAAEAAPEDASAEQPAPESPSMRASGGGQPGAIIYAQAAPAPEPAAPGTAAPAGEPRAVIPPARRRGLAEDARDVLSGVGRLFRPRRGG